MKIFWRYCIGDPSTIIKCHKKALGIIFEKLAEKVLIFSEYTKLVP
jgi:hypothetical protein